MRHDCNSYSGMKLKDLNDNRNTSQYPFIWRVQRLKLLSIKEEMHWLKDQRTFFKLHNKQQISLYMYSDNNRISRLRLKSIKCNCIFFFLRFTTGSRIFFSFFAYIRHSVVTKSYVIYEDTIKNGRLSCVITLMI